MDDTVSSIPGGPVISVWTTKVESSIRFCGQSRFIHDAENSTNSLARYPLLLWGQSLAIMACEFKEQDIFPVAEEVVFSEEAIGFAAAESQFANAPELYFVLQRRSRVRGCGRPYKHKWL